MSPKRKFPEYVGWTDKDLEQQEKSVDTIFNKMAGRSEKDLDPKDQPLTPVTETTIVTETPSPQSETMIVTETTIVSQTTIVTETTKNIWDTAEPVRGHLRIPNTYLDSIARTLDPLEQVIYLQLFRLSVGYGKDECLIGLAKLSERCNISESTIQRTIKKMVAKNLIKKINWDIEKGKAPGSIYKLVIPTTIVTETKVVNPTTIVNLTNNKDLKKKSNINTQNTDIRKLAEIIDQIRDKHRGQSLPPSELSALVKEECGRRGVKFDQGVYGELVR